MAGLDQEFWAWFEGHARDVVLRDTLRSMEDGRQMIAHLDRVKAAGTITLEPPEMDLAE